MIDSCPFETRWGTSKVVLRSVYGSTRTLRSGCGVNKRMHGSSDAQTSFFGSSQLSDVHRSSSRFAAPERAGAVHLLAAIKADSFIFGGSQRAHRRSLRSIFRRTTSSFER